MKIYAKRSWRWALLSVFAGACATTPPASFYTLAPLPGADLKGSASYGQSPAIGIGPISFPVFLDRAQLVSRSSESMLSVDELHRWGGSLQDDFPRVLGENLAYLLGTSRILLPTAEIRYPVHFRLAVDVLRFETTREGDAVLKARWALLNPYTDEALVVNEGSYRVKAKSGEPAARVDAMSQALGNFSRDVADALRKRPKPRKPVAELSGL